MLSTGLHFASESTPPADYTHGGLTNDSLSYTRKLHHIDGRDPPGLSSVLLFPANWL